VATERIQSLRANAGEMLAMAAGSPGSRGSLLSQEGKITMRRKARYASFAKANH